ncbi:MAG: hypothetical protein V1746_07255 [bacterium]
MSDDKKLEERIKMRMAGLHENDNSVAQKMRRRRKILLWIGALLFLAILIVRMTKGALH